VEQLCVKVAKGFFRTSSPSSISRVLRCGTLMGFSAREALKQSKGVSLDIKGICADPITSYVFCFGLG
jgi:hypothetical protein